MSALYNFDIFQGETFNVRLTGSNENGTYFNLSGYTASGFIKYRYTENSFLYDIRPTIHPSYVSGIIDIEIPSSGTSSLPATVLLYDIEIYKNSTGTRMLAGKMFVSPEVTK